MSLLCFLGRHRDKAAYDHPSYKGGAHVVESERCERAMVNGEYRWYLIQSTKEALSAKPKAKAG